MSPTLQDIVISPGTYALLKANGMSDQQRGVSMYDGWAEICKEMGFSNSRTPAREAYEDGYYEAAAKR